MEDREADDVLDLAQETPPENVFIAPSINRPEILQGASYSYYSPVPAGISQDQSTECVLGVDEAGRGPVLGPMVYGVFYLPKSIEKSLLADTYHFDDSKVLTPIVRSNLMRSLCEHNTDLQASCGWATRILSARDISSGMLRPHGSYNLNAQAMDATIGLIQGVLDLGVNIREIFIDTIGNPQVYQRKLERIFPAVQITVAKKADSLYPCVSAASICAKVTRDAALDVSYEAYATDPTVATGSQNDSAGAGWGSGYPSDSRCTAWLKQNMDPIFGWGPECRFSWGTAKDLLEAGKAPIKVDWPDEDDAEDSMRLTRFFASESADEDTRDELAKFFGKPVSELVF